jgi:hypothetical protein
MKLSRSFIYKAFVSLATTALVSVANFALAQEQTESRSIPPAEITWNEQRFLIESDLAIGKMSLGMSVRLGSAR